MFEFDKPRPKTVLSLTPLIDVVFILLLFFMLATNFETEQAFDVSAAAGSAKSSANELPGKLHLLNETSISLDGVVMDEQAVKQTLRNRYNNDRTYAVTVSVANGISVQSLFELITLARQTGVQQVSIGTKTQAVAQ